MTDLWQGGILMDAYYMSDCSYFDDGVPLSLMDKFQTTISMFHELRSSIFLKIEDLERTNFYGINTVEINRNWRMIKQIDEQIKMIKFRFYTTPISDLTRVIAIEYPDGRIVKVPYAEAVQ